jgi:hypothetical protein
MQGIGWQVGFSAGRTVEPSRNGDNDGDLSIPKSRFLHENAKLLLI